jgi:hypothetical protein
MSRVDTSTTAQSSSVQWLLGLRVTATLQLAVVLMQGLTAGRLVLAPNDDALPMHAAGAIAVHVVAVLQLAAAFLLWRSSRGPVWPTVLSALALVMGFIQAAVGDAGNMKVHVPLALLLTMTITVVAVWSWLPGAKATAQP